MEDLGYMAKMRVNELARELGIENKQIIEFLSTTEYAVKSHSSNVEEEAQKLVRGKFTKGGEGAPAKAEGKEAPAIRAGQAAKPKGERRGAPKEKIQYNSSI